jgi:hypothetical protein
VQGLLETAVNALLVKQLQRAFSLVLSNEHKDGRHQVDGRELVCSVKFFHLYLNLVDHVESHHAWKLHIEHHHLHWSD